MSPGLLKVSERAKQHPDARFNSLAHLLDEEALGRAFQRIRKDAAVGVDGITKEQYGQNLEGSLKGLHERLRAGRYRHQPILRVHIPKASGKTRPIGISSVEDKIVQGALREVLEAIYEQDFLECSYGFRPNRGAHDALRALNQMVSREGIVVILEADIQAFFDSIDRRKLLELLQIRVADPPLLRLLGKCLHVGVLDGEEFSKPDEGTAQGSIISPMFGNVYLHYVLDLWFEHDIKPRLKGHARLIRYADDFVIGFARQDDAVRVLDVLHKRMAKYGLTLHPDKTRLIAFAKPHAGQNDGSGPGTFDFLGFTMYWCKTRRGGWRLGMKTRKARIQRALVALGDWCRRHRHQPLKEQHAALSRRIRGHFQYFGVNGNARSLQQVRFRVERTWLKWLQRRSQRGHRLTWERFRAYLKAHPLPPPRISVQIWAKAP
ncbi:MAG: RNA-directed polymerase [Anaerolineales bacterium]|nr:RNA-directed polymerase [Anaerolineales bacterium]